MTKIIQCMVLSIILSTVSYAQINTLEEAMSINMSGILAQRFKMAIVAENIANLMTLKDEETGLPYQKQYVELEASDVGVKIVDVAKSTEPFGRYFDPAAPQSDEDGYFYLPNVNMPNEMVTLKHTEAMYEANINAFKLTKTMYQSAVELLK
ncbi:flagellar basal body rod protein FlgC [Candidatus Marinamargulisbacteria bacterium SCGC AG-343-D04]|nr:flagellar basal body rod protein FlgC [Candidatus Marinamargulisbacteria bacterium SCGC AG-343-D04]